MTDELVQRGITERPAVGLARRGRLRTTIAGTLEIREAVESAFEGPGLNVGGHRLSPDDVAELVDEGERYLQERGRR